MKNEENLILAYNGKEIKFKIIHNGKAILNRIYLIYKELSTNNFEIEKLDFKKMYKVIINVIDAMKSEEISLFLYKSMNVLKKFKKFLINSNKLGNNK